MLRQALDEAQSISQHESTSLTPSNESSYGAINLHHPEQSSLEGDFPSISGDVEDDDDDSDDDEDESMLEEWRNEEEAPPSYIQRVWTYVKNAFLVVANVENLWDTPPDSHSVSARVMREHSRRNHLIVLFWFVVLATSYAGERSTFKLLVDRTAPFRLFAVEMVTASHAILLGISTLIMRCLSPGPAMPIGLPIVDVGLMALLDTATLLMVFLSGRYVPPTLTVILVQFTLPLTACLTQCVHPDGRCTCRRKHNNNRLPTVSLDDSTHRRSNTIQNAPPPPTTHVSPSAADDNRTTVSVENVAWPHWGGLSAEHVWGSLILTSAVLLALCPAFYSIADPDFFIYADTIPIRTAYNTLIYVSSCIPAAASQLYKEYIFLSYKQPVNIGSLNVLLSIFQFIFASVMSPLMFGLQGLGAKGNWESMYPSNSLSTNYWDGLKCFFRLLPDDEQETKYPEEARCDFTLGLVLMYAISVMCVGVAVDKIVNAGATKVMYRGISAGIILAVLSMHAYDMHIPEFNYGPAIDGLNLVCLILLILGSEVYHRVSLQESTFETVYPAVEVFADDDL